MSDGERDILRHQQSQLLCSIRGDEKPAAAFDAARIALAREMLVNKRRRMVERAWPGLESALDTGWQHCFLQYAQQVAPPPDGRGRADAIGFLRFLENQGKLTDELSLQWLRYRARNGFATARLPDSGVVAIAVRFPLLSVRVIRFGKRRPSIG